MKKLVLFFTLLSCFTSLKAQTEIKINPIGLLFKSPDISVEFAAKENVGIEPFIGISFFSLTTTTNGIEDKFTSNGFSYGAHGKYYFGIDKGIDKFYAGIYLGGGQSKFSNSSTGTSASSFSRTRLGAGFELGYKWVMSNNFLFECGAGLGRKIINRYSDGTGKADLAALPLLNIDGFFRFNVGYRLGGDSGSGKKKR